jgi:hypothetical protein
LVKAWPPNCMENSRAIRSELSGSLVCLKGDNNEGTASSMGKHQRLFRLEVGVEGDGADVLRTGIELERGDADILIQRQRRPLALRHRKRDLIAFHQRMVLDREDEAVSRSRLHFHMSATHPSTTDKCTRTHLIRSAAKSSLHTTAQFVIAKSSVGHFFTFIGCKNTPSE